MKKNNLLILLIVLFPLGFLLFFGKALNHKFRTLPYYHPAEMLLERTNNELGKTYFIPEYSFTNANGNTVSRETLPADAVCLFAPYSMNSEYLAVITKRLLSATHKYKDETNIKIIGLNSDGFVQDADKLKDYMYNLNKNRDQSENFLYLSSSSKETMAKFIEALGIKNIDNSALIVLVDPNNQIRGRYNLNAERQINDAIGDIALLRKEISDGKYKAKKVLRDNN